MTLRQVALLCGEIMPYDLKKIPNLPPARPRFSSRFLPYSIWLSKTPTHARLIFVCNGLIIVCTLSEMQAKTSYTYC